MDDRRCRCGRGVESLVPTVDGEPLYECVCGQRYLLTMTAVPSRTGRSGTNADGQADHSSTSE